MSTTFANTINGNPIYASRAESDKDGNQIDTTYAKLSDIPPGVTVDQTYNSSSTNAQSGTAVAEAVSDALSTINQVPASTSSDEDKVLTVDSNGDPVWAVSQSGGSTYTAGDGIDIDANNEISAKVDGTTITVNASGELEAIGGTGPQVQANWAETDQSDPSYIQNKPTIPAAQVNSDWNASSGVAQILNKPSIPTKTSDLQNDSGFITSVPVTDVEVDGTSVVNGQGVAEITLPTQVQADWNESDSSDPSYIQNKPTIPAAVTVDQTYNSSSTNPQSGTAVAGAIAGVNQVPVSTSADEDKVLTVNSSGNPVWAAAQGGAQVQSDWTESDTTDPSYIQNKPTTKSISAGSGISITESSNSVVISATGGGSGTVDQTYNASSTNAQSGTAVAGAIAGVNQVPASTSSDEDKVLTVNSSGTPVWAAAQGGGSQVQSDWTESDTTDPAYIQNKPTEKSLVAGSNISFTENASNVTISATVPAQEQADWNESDSSDPSYIKNKPTIPSAVTVDQTYNSSSTNPQSGTAVAGALATVRQVPTTQSTDNGKVLGVTDGNGTLGWVTQSGGTSYSAGNMISLTNNEIAVSTTAGIIDIQQVAALPANPLSHVLYLIPAT